MVRSLDKKWKELLFAFSGFGPNFLMLIMGSYFSDALNPSALESGEQFQAIMPGVCFILPALFPILFALGKMFDGIIDIPFAYVTDTLSTKWGRRRPPIAVCFVPMVLSFVLCWIPVGGVEHPLFNTIWVTVFSMSFFACYTMSLISFYGSLSTVCTDEPQRLRVSGYKAFFDTISYCMVYALVPAMLSGSGLQIDTFVFICTPMMLTMIIPLFMIKEGEKYGYPENNGTVPEKITIKESISLTFKNRIFRNWLVVNCFTYFGLQMFLAAMNGMIIGGMGMNGMQMAILNTFAFGPVPVMLYLFKKAKSRYGMRGTYQSCLLVFAVAILSFFFASRFIMGEGNMTVKLAIGIAGSVLGSWAIGAFFMMPYLAPAQISGVEEKFTGRNHSAMYFAGNAVVTSVVGALSGGLLYEYIKNIFIAKGHGLVWAEATDSLSASEVAYEKIFGVAGSAEEVAQYVFNFGNLIVPFVVLIACVVGFFFAFRLPKDFTPDVLVAEYKKMDPSLQVAEADLVKPAEDRQEIIFVQIGLSILSGFVFGLIWVGQICKAVKGFCKKFLALPAFLLSCFVPFLSVIGGLWIRKQLLAAAKAKGVDVKINPVILVLTSLILPVLFANVIALALFQRALNKIYANAEEQVA